MKIEIDKPRYDLLVRIGKAYGPVGIMQWTEDTSYPERSGTTVVFEIDADHLETLKDVVAGYTENCCSSDPETDELELLVELLYESEFEPDDQGIIFLD